MPVLFQDGKFSNELSLNLFYGSLKEGMEYSISYSFEGKGHLDKCYYRGDGCLYIHKESGSVYKVNYAFMEENDFIIQAIYYVGDTQFCEDIEAFLQYQIMNGGI